MLLLCAASVSAQDVIVKKDGSTIVCRVVELTATEITYKKWSDLNGSNYVMERSAASAINYENGKKVDLSEVENLYQPNNQNDGVQQYNDRALLMMDYEAQKPELNLKKAKNLKTLGWIGGSVFAAVGLFLIADSFNSYGDPKHSPFEDDLDYILAGGACLAVGTGWTIYFLSKAKRFERGNMYSYHLLKKEIQLKNNSSLCPSIDLLSNQAYNKATIGLCLRYNF